MAVAIAALLIASGAARAGEDGKDSGGASDRPWWRTNVFKRVLTDQKFLVTKWWPSEFRRPSFSAPLLAATIAAIRSTAGNEQSGVDFTVLHGLEPERATGIDRIAGDFTRIGNGPFVIAALGVTYLSARHAGNDGLAATSSLAAESLIDSGIYIVALKTAFARIRPNQPGQGEFFQYGRPSASSFPSGHAFGAFSVASVFAESYHDVRWVPWVAYGGASLIAASRAVLGRHFPTDLLVGGLLGDSMGHAVVARAESKEDSPRGWRKHVVPVVNPQGGVGIGLDFSR